MAIPSLCTRLVVTQSRHISTTQVLLAEPPRKRRRIDPALLKIRVERKIKKTEREIARIEKEPRRPIPIEEYQLTRAEREELNSRPGRKLEEFGISDGILKAAARLWSFHRNEQCRIQEKSLRQVEKAQMSALNELKRINLDLYNKAIEANDIGLIPYSSSLIRKDTPPLEGYTPPDGYIKDVSKEWVM